MIHNVDGFVDAAPGMPLDVCGLGRGCAGYNWLVGAAEPDCRVSPVGICTPSGTGLRRASYDVVAASCRRVIAASEAAERGMAPDGDI